MSRKRRAAILVLTLWITVVLGLISASLLEEVYLELKVAKLHRDDFEAMALARAGVARAVADLRNDMVMDYGGKMAAIDALGDVWAQMDDKKNKLNIEMGNRHGKYTVWVEDEASKFNLNAIDLNMLKTLLYELGYEEADAQIVASAIMDWRDPDDRTLPPGSGIEDEYYSAAMVKAAGGKRREGDPLVYHCKDDMFSSVDELLSVYGVTPQLFYGVDVEKETPPNPIEQLKTRVKGLRHKSRRDRTPGLRDVFTVYSQGSININTADMFVLRVLMRAVTGDQASAKSLAQKIVNLRGTDARGKARNENAIRNLNDLARIAGIPPPVISRMQRLARLSVRSNVFRITALGEVGQAQHLITAVVRRTYETYDPSRVDALADRGGINARFLAAFQRRWGSRRDPINEASVRVIQWFEL